MAAMSSNSLTPEERENLDKIRETVLRNREGKPVTMETADYEVHSIIAEKEIDKPLVVLRAGGAAFFAPPELAVQVALDLMQCAATAVLTSRVLQLMKSQGATDEEIRAAGTLFTEAQNGD